MKIEFIPCSYNDLDFWAAHPKKVDNADISLIGLTLIAENI